MVEKKTDDKPASHELQARQELANATELGNDESALAARKRLDAAGEARSVAAAQHEHKVDVRKQAPQGRQAPGKQTS